jgi:anti-sigma regulatory factor (Ser/Thr protein kinase)
VKETRRFPREATSVGAARRFATQLLAGAPAKTVDAVELMVSELATNCIRHAEAAFEVTVSRARGRVRIAVTDDAGGTPTMRSPGPEDPTGRGLLIVDAFSDAWGVEREGRGGKTVWFMVTVPATVCTA